jgi:geranylgeranyl diphosphate synthase type II
MSSTLAKAPREHGVASDAAPFDGIKDDIEARLIELIPDHGNSHDLLSKAMHSAVLGGNRMRPVLLMTIVRGLGYDAPAVLDLACSVEIVHAASLILDDLPCMDDTKLRRGLPAIHIQFGEDVAVLAAVALLSQAFKIVSCADKVSPAVRTQLMTVLAQAVGAEGLAMGQLQDLHGELERPVEDIAETYALKTAALLVVAVEMAAIVTQAGTDVAQCLRQFACAAGQAFQIRDDLLDTGTADFLAMHGVIGKDTGQDADKATLVGRLGTEPARIKMENELRLAGQYLQKALGPDNQTCSLLATVFPRCGLPTLARPALVKQ